MANVYIRISIWVFYKGVFLIILKMEQKTNKEKIKEVKRLILEIRQDKEAMKKLDAWIKETSS